MVRFDKVVPVLRVTDLDRSVSFYAEVLGFQVVWRAAEEGGARDCMLAAGTAELLLSTGAHLGDGPAFTGTLYFHTDDVDAYYQRVKDLAELVWPLEAMDYGQREFGLRDPDGYTLAFAEPVEP